MNPDPFAALGLAADPGLTDAQVHAAWRQIAAATHPDRADGGDPARYTAASAAYADLRTPWGRSEAYADLTDFAGEPPTTPRFIAQAAAPPLVPPWQPLLDLARVPSRIARGRPRRLLIRAAIAALLSLAVLQLIPGTASAPADIAGLILWFALTGRHDLAPPAER